MRTRHVRLSASTRVVPCPRCGNRTEFNVHWEAGSAGRDVWLECVCGHHTGPQGRCEAEWEGSTAEITMVALSCWNDTMRSASAAR